MCLSQLKSYITVCCALLAMFCTGLRCPGSVSAAEEGHGRLRELAERHYKS